MTILQSGGFSTGQGALLKQIGLVGIARLIRYARGLILLPLMTKTLPIEDYGAWSVVIVTVSLLLPFAMLGLPSAMVRFIPAEKERSKIATGIFSTLSLVCLTSLVFAACMFFLSEYIAITFLKDIAFASIIKISSILVVLRSMEETSLESFRCFGQVNRYSALIIIQTIVELTLIAALIFSGLGLWGAVLGSAISTAFIIILSLIFIISRTGFTLPSLSIVRSYLAFGIFLVPSVVFELVIASSDRYMIGFYLGATQVGIYSAAYGLGSMAVLTLYIITYTLAPVIFKSHDEHKTNETKQYLSRVHKYYYLFSIPSVLGLSILAKPLLQNLTTPDFVSAGMFIVPLIAASMLFEGMRSIYGYPIMLAKKTTIFASATVIAGLVNICLNVILIPHFGIFGAAVSTFIAYILVGFIMYINSRRYLRFQVEKGFIIKSTIASAVMAAGIWTINPTSVFGILIAITAGMIIYFSLIFFLKGINKEEVKVVCQALGLRLIYERL